MSFYQANAVEACTFVLANSVTNSVTRKCSFQRHLCLVKDRKLLIPVRCTTRKFSLQPPPAGRNDWHVRFWAPKGPEGSSFVFRSTGTKEIAAAKRIAAQIIESFWTDAGRGAERLKLRSNSATIGRRLPRQRVGPRFAGRCGLFKGIGVGVWQGQPALTAARSVKVATTSMPTTPPISLPVTLTATVAPMCSSRTARPGSFREPGKGRGSFSTPRPSGSTSSASPISTMTPSQTCFTAMKLEMSAI